jgi:hypothetical protein
MLRSKIYKIGKVTGYKMGFCKVKMAVSFLKEVHVRV